MTLCSEERVRTMFSGVIFTVIKLQTKCGKSQLSEAVESDSVIPGISKVVSLYESSYIKRLIDK